MSGFKWNNYEDGSGSMSTKYGHTFFEYDKSTDEIRYPDGCYRSMSDDWRNDAENHYMNIVLPKETHYVNLLQQGIYAPYFKGRKFDRDLDDAKFVVIDETSMMLKDKFMDIVSSMRQAEDKNFSDSTISTHDAMLRIKNALDKNSFEQDSLNMIYEGETIVINKSDLHALTSDGLSKSKERELPYVSEDNKVCDGLSLC